MIADNIKGILVGSDDHAEYGYNWIIDKKEWNNGCAICTEKISKYGDIKDFHIYFYVFGKKTDDPVPDSNEFKKRIFGFADLVKVEKNKYPDYDYKHYVKIKNLRLFTPKIRLEEFKEELEYYDWSNEQKKLFGRTLATHGLLLTNKDCEFLRSFTFKKLNEIQTSVVSLRYLSINRLNTAKFAKNAKHSNIVLCELCVLCG